MTNLPYETWPVAIFESRYSGVYEGGAWFALANADEVNLEEGPYADDATCDEWFHENQNAVGVGDTPNEALQALLFKLEYANTVKRIIEIGPKIGKSGYSGDFSPKNL